MTDTLYHNAAGVSSVDWMLSALRVLPMMVGSLAKFGISVLRVDLSKHGSTRASIHVYECRKLKEWAESWGPVAEAVARGEADPYPYEVKCVMNGIKVYALATEEDIREMFPDKGVSDGD